ncbi:Pr6Pr family membrane protein [Aestuariivirga litoralis]|uniref:Pr6Pr family membrane protein n=1 Tax=Aestuariivirga litoralis TaxID=2650924 RepID=UPI0018C68BE8|nr:Pr6Pr family membrane protein [Aestuariivirga litoralis]MBG1231248.1 hypothetical protein [Aestuariivirga litoralis]
MSGAGRPLQRFYEMLGAAFVALAVITQFIVSVPAFEEKGMSFAGSMVNVLSFFTILTNIAVVLFYLASLLNWKSSILRSPKWQAAMALYIAIVACVYIAVLQDIWEPQGIFKLLDISLHYISPALFILYWLIFVPKGATAYLDSFTWLAPGLAYVVYAVSRGALTGLYPYPFLDAGTLGYLIVLRNVVFLLAFFFALGLVVVTVDHLLARLKTRTREL